MCPERVLRPSISRARRGRRRLYHREFPRANTSDTALAERRAAMTRALGPLHSRSALFLDFYDRARMATWVRHHAEIGLWVRSKVGRAVPGWRPYGAWAFSPDGVADTYLLEDQARLYVGMTDERGVPVAEGIRHLRDILRGPHGVVGLSGVGKTRLVQALFDARVGENSLNSARAVYTDMADSPDPQPVTMATDLIAARQSAILIVDNCPPDLHQRLSERCRAPDSTVTVITIEYTSRRPARRHGRLPLGACLGRAHRKAAGAPPSGEAMHAPSRVFPAAMRASHWRSPIPEKQLGVRVIADICHVHENPLRRRKPARWSIPFKVRRSPARDTRCRRSRRMTLRNSMGRWRSSAT